MEEHHVHVGDFADIPLGQILVERFGTIEHNCHDGDFANVPLRHVLVERFGPYGPVEQLINRSR